MIYGVIYHECDQKISYRDYVVIVLLLLLGLRLWSSHLEPPPFGRGSALG